MLSNYFMKLMTYIVKTNCTSELIRNDEIFFWTLYVRT